LGPRNDVVPAGSSRHGHRHGRGLRHDDIRRLRAQRGERHRARPSSLSTAALDRRSPSRAPTPLANASRLTGARKSEGPNHELRTGALERRDGSCISTLEAQPFRPMHILVSYSATSSIDMGIAIALISTARWMRVRRSRVRRMHEWRWVEGGMDRTDDIVGISDVLQVPSSRKADLGRLKSTDTANGWACVDRTVPC
jgi:hypothetical protein